VLGLEVDGGMGAVVGSSVCATHPCAQHRSSRRLARASRVFASMTCRSTPPRLVVTVGHRAGAAEVSRAARCGPEAPRRRLRFAARGPGDTWTLEPSRFICVARSVVSSAVAAMRVVVGGGAPPRREERDIRLLELDVRGREAGEEIRESSTASEEKTGGRSATVMGLG